MQAEKNLWAATAPPRPSAPPLEGAQTADLVIIGGGFTGCSAALRAAELGAEVRLLEADDISVGASGRNSGLVNAGLWLKPEEIEARLGIEGGRRLSEALGAAPALVFDLIEKHEIACEAQRAGTLHCAHAPSGYAELEERSRQLNARGAGVSLLSADEAAARIGTERFHGALFDPRAGTIQPMAYCIGLARAAVRAGATLHAGTPALSIARVDGQVDGQADGQDEGAWRVETPAGSVTARALLLATNAYHRDAAGAPAPEAVRMGYFHIATAPLSDNLRRSILPGGEGCWDTATVLSSFRMDAGGRLILGGVGALDHGASGVHKAWAAKQIARLFPQIADQPIEHAWFGRIAMTADHLPKIVRLGPNGFSIFGYSGRGIGPGTLSGRMMAQALISGDESVLPLEPIDGHSESFAGVRRRFLEAGATLAHAASAAGALR